MSTKNSSRFTPVIIAVSVVVGILIGTFYAKHFAGNRLGIINGSSNKLNALLRIVDDQYVDTVNMADLVEKAMPQILAELVEMHSVHIITANDFPHQFHQVLLRCRMSRIEEIFALVRNAYFFHPLGDRLTAERSNMLLIP